MNITFDKILLILDRCIYLYNDAIRYTIICRRVQSFIALPIFFIELSQSDTFPVITSNLSFNGYKNVIK